MWLPLRFELIEGETLFFLTVSPKPRADFWLWVCAVSCVFHSFFLQGLLKSLHTTLSYAFLLSAFPSLLSALWIREALVWDTDKMCTECDCMGKSFCLLGKLAERFKYHLIFFCWGGYFALEHLFLAEEEVGFICFHLLVLAVLPPSLVTLTPLCDRKSSVDLSVNMKS